MRILAVVAHPDDEVLGPGGTLLRHTAAGDLVRVAIVGDCRPAGRSEAVEVARLMGTDLSINSAGGLKIRSEPSATLVAVEDLVARFQPQVVYTHHAGDVNADHRVLADAVAVACRPYAAPLVEELLAFYTPSSTEWGAPFRADLFVDIGAQLEGKLAAMAAYASEGRPAPHPRSQEALAATARFWGSQVGYAAAEPFTVLRIRR